MKRINKEILKRVQADYLCGVPGIDIAMRYGISQSTVSRMISRPAVTSMTAEMDEVVAQLRQELAAAQTELAALKAKETV